MFKPFSQYIYKETRVQNSYKIKPLKYTYFSFILIMSDEIILLFGYGKILYTITLK